MVNTLFVIDIIQNGEILDELLHLWSEKFSASRTCEYVGRSEIQQAYLAECMSTRQNSRNLILIVVSVITNWTVCIH